MRHYGAVFLIALGLCGSGHAQPASPLAAEVAPALAAVRPHAIRAHMGFLADDLLEGRRTGTRGYDLAAKYVAAHDDYAGIDVRGKLVARLAGAPTSFPHDQRAFYSAPWVGASNALAHGAAGVLGIFTPELERIFPGSSCRSRPAGPPCHGWTRPAGRTVQDPEARF